ncbi:signal peptide containing protein [Theileria equi strain WA]|uniref:Signal peptide containing protein n=1 Tax=Theileria equi strain WA TaxID=1537102 RepID=L1LFB9_THEEQ|nr:signal peptide containing protein [Theileria equi strain WA]EKX74132.1 signal peptide containing protein [Theileria equi strain WA]|eukprot:XP_004833584.1 signal peptide containing protein [Theileria equi strain WA]
MRVLTVLWTLCLVRLCSAGFWCCSGGGTTDDDNGPYGGSKENLRSAPSKPVVPQSTGQAGGTTPITLDLAKPDETNIRVGNQSRDDGISYRGFIPNSGHHISSVVDGGSSVWKAEKNERCKFVESHGEVSSEEAPVEVASDTALQEGENVDKPEVPPDEDSVVPQSYEQSGLVLDLSNPDQSKVHIGDRSGNGVNSKKYYPKDGVLVSSVVDGGSSVWTAGTGESSGFVTSYTRGDSSLITIGISKGSDSKLDFKYFEKNADGKWTSMTEKNDFLRKLQEMRKSVSPPNPSSTTTPS